MVHPLEAAASRAPVEMCHVLERLAGHLPVSLLHVRRLLLGHGLEDALPDVSEQRRYRREEADGGGGDGEVEGTEALCPEGLEEGRGVEEATQGGGGGSGHGGHFDDRFGVSGWFTGYRSANSRWMEGRFRICAKVMELSREILRLSIRSFGLVLCVPSLAQSQNPAVWPSRCCLRVPLVGSRNRDRWSESGVDKKVPLPGPKVETGNGHRAGRHRGDPPVSKNSGMGDTDHARSPRLC